MPKDESLASVFGSDLESFLRRTLSGYIFVLVVILQIRPRLYDLGATIAFLVVAGTIVGQLIYLLYHSAYGWCAWHSTWFSEQLGLDHIRSLREISWYVCGFHADDRYLRGIWDAIFFEGETAKPHVQKAIRQRILSQFSSAHASATSAVAILVADLVSWLLRLQWIGKTLEGLSVSGLSECVQGSLIFDILSLIVVVALVGSYRRSCRDGGALENLFVDMNRPEIEDSLRKHMHVTFSLD